MSDNRVHTWTDERIEMLRKCVADGFSSSEAGKKLGISRNAAMGKAFRLGLAFGRRTAASTEAVAARRAAERVGRLNLSAPRKPRPPQPPKPRPTYAERRRVIREATARGERVGGFLPPKPVEVPPDARPVQLLALTSQHCRWPISTPADAADTTFCGALPTFGNVYCAHHWRAAWTPQSQTAAKFERSLRRWAAA